MRAVVRRTYVPIVTKALTYGVLGIVGSVLICILVSLFRFMNATGLTPGGIIDLVTNAENLLPQSNNRTQVLVLGIGGGDHVAPDLTDTMMILSLNPRGKNVRLLSLPRDIWSDTLKDKINSAYHYGEEKRVGGGFTLAKAIVEETVGIPIHRVILIDFSGFTDSIDLLGGIDVHVSESFTDSRYPIAGKENDECGGDPTYACRYETVRFDKGLQHMNGENALKYVRSRHADGDQGTDFARGKRQQDVLEALQKRLTDPMLWLSWDRAQSLIRELNGVAQSDMNAKELLGLGRSMMTIRQNQITKISGEEYFEEAESWRYDGRYVLIPKISHDDLSQEMRKILFE